MSVRHATITARLGTQTRTVDGLTVNHGFVLDGGGIAGLDGSVTWADSAPVDVPALPTDAGWDRGPGEQLTIDWTDDQGTVRVATARLDGSSGDGLGGVSTDLTDWTSRLATTCEIRPTAAIMPRNLALPGSTHRRVWLDTTWLTAEAMRQAGFHPCQAMQRSAVAYHSMAGSAWPSPDRGTTAGTMGEVRQAYRLNDYGDVHLDASPSATQGDDTAVITNAYVLGVTRRRRNSTVAHWQMTQDLGVRKPDAADRGRCTVRPLRSSDGPGMRLDWDATSVRVQRVMPAGGTVTLGIYPRGESMRWSVVIRANGTATVYNDLSRETPVAQLTSTGVTSLPTDSSEASYILEYPGRASAFQLSRSDSPFLVTQAVSAQIRRSTYAGRYVGAVDWVAPTEAGNFLALQARAEVGWRGIGLAQWIDEDGRLVNADFLSLASGPVDHTLATQSSSPDAALDSASWSVPGDGPWRAVEVTARRPRVLRRDHPTLPLGEGSRETVERGDMLEQVIHPAQDQTWLHIDTSAYLAGHPYSAPTNKELDRQWGTWVGGHRVDADGEALGWVRPDDISEWSLNASGEVRNALRVLDPATVVVEGTVVTPAGQSLVTMPYPKSQLPEHRHSQPLAQIRGNGLVEWSVEPVEVEVSGDDRHQTYTHDGGMFLSNPAYQEYAAAEIAASLTDPVVLHTAQVAINPRVRVGDKVALRHTYATGWTRTVVGVVAQRRIDLPGRGDTMTLTVVGISDTKTPPAAPLPPPDPTPPQPAPPLPPGPGPDPDPPIDPADPPTLPPPPAPSTLAVTVDVNLLRIGWDGLDSTGASALGPNFGALEVAVSGSLVTTGDVVGRAVLEDDGWHRLVHGPVPLDTTWYVRARILDIWGQEGPWSAAVVVQVDPLVDPGQFEDALARLLAAEDGLDDLAADLANIGAALPDPEFTDPTQWDVPAGTTFRTDLTDHPYGRTTGLTIPAGANTTQSAAALPAEEGQRWWLAVLYRADAATSSTVAGGLQVAWSREGLPDVVASVDTRPLRDFPVGEWVLLSGYAVAPEGATAARIRIRRSTTSAPASTVASARLLRASGGVADPVVLAGFIGALKIDVGQLVVTEGATINEAVILKLAADLAEFMEVRFENAVGGVLNVLAELIVNVGNDRVVIGSPAGGIGYYVPVGEAANPTWEQVARFGRDLQFVTDEGGIYGITPDGDLGVREASIAADPSIAGTHLLGTLASRPDEVTLDTDLGHLDQLAFAGNHATWTFDSSYPWSTLSERVVGEVAREQQAGRGVLVVLSGTVVFQDAGDHRFFLRLRKTQVDLPTSSGPSRPVLSSPQIFPLKVSDTGGLNHGSFTHVMGLHVPTRSEMARWLVTVENWRNPGPHRVSDLSLSFLDLGPMHDVSLDAVVRVEPESGTPPPTPPAPKKRYTSRWYASSVRRWQRPYETPSGDRPGQALQGWTSGMNGDPFDSILGFTGTAHHGEVGRTISAALSGVSLSDIERVRIRTSQAAGFSNVVPRVGIQSSSTATPVANQNLNPMSPGQTRYDVMNSAFRSGLHAGMRYITYGPGTRTNRSYAAYHGTSGGNSRRVELEVTYRR